MSTTTVEKVDDGTLERVIEKATPEQRRYLLEKLLPKVIEDSLYMPQAITNAAGERVGYFMPNGHPTSAEPPVMSLEFRAEVRRRLDTPENSTDLEGFLKLVEVEEARLLKR